MKRLFTAKTMQAADKSAIERGTSGLKLMQNAGKAVAKTCLKEFPSVKNVIILCGKGNNGGDGYVVARYLLEKGLNVIVLEQSQKPSSKESMTCRKHYLELGKSKALNLKNLNKEIKNADLIVDAIFGSGLSRAVTGELAQIIELVNSSKKKVLSVDIPSGIIADRPEIIAKHIRADLTVQLAGAKISSAFYPSKYAYGKIKIVKIGISKKILKEQSNIKLLDDKAVAKLLPKRPADAHKYNVGTVLVIAGSAQYSGAAELCCRAALRAGAGLVSLASTNSFSNTWPEIIYNKIRLSSAVDDISKIDSKYASARAIGPGLNDKISSQLDKIIPLSPNPSVIDASSLNKHKVWQAEVIKHGKCILSPHFGEAAKLLQTSSQEIANDPIQAATRISKKFNAITVLKSATTVITDGKDIFVSTSGHAGMATGGSGDVLTGVIAAFVAQNKNLLEATAAAVYLHGKAGELVATKYGNGLIASDLCDAFAKSWQKLSQK